MAIECICVDGTVIPSLIIFKGENISIEWLVLGELREK